MGACVSRTRATAIEPSEEANRRLTAVNVNPSEEAHLSSIQCPVCFDHYDDETHAPCTLPCGHSFCLDHAHMIQRCPICREVFSPALGLTKSIALCESACVIRYLVDLLERRGGVGTEAVEARVFAPPTSSSTLVAQSPETSNEIALGRSFVSEAAPAFDESEAQVALERPAQGSDDGSVYYIMYTEPNAAPASEGPPVPELTVRTDESDDNDAEPPQVLEDLEQPPISVITIQSDELDGHLLESPQTLDVSIKPEGHESESPPPVWTATQFDASSITSNQSTAEEERDENLGLPFEIKSCGHACEVSSTVRCCAHMDKRPPSRTGGYVCFVEGVGLVSDAPRHAFYCATCQERYNAGGAICVMSICD